MSKSVSKNDVLERIADRLDVADQEKLKRFVSQLVAPHRVPKLKAELNTRGSTFTIDLELCAADGSRWSLEALAKFLGVLGVDESIEAKG